MMEDKIDGQNTQEQDRPADDRTQTRTAPIGEVGEESEAELAEDRALIAEAAANQAASNDAMRAGGFGDHKGIEGFPRPTPEPSFGPDEEGEAPLDRDAVDSDRAAWVHRDN